ELRNVSKRFGETKITEDVNLLIKPGDRIGIVGRNGSGKSTLLNIIAGKLPVDTGEIEIGRTVKLAYYTQESMDMDVNKRMIEYIKETAEMIHTLDGKIVSARSEEHTSELQSRENLVCRLLLEKKKNIKIH